MEGGKNISTATFALSLLLLVIVEVRGQERRLFNYEGYQLFNVRDPEKSVFNFGLLFQYNQPWYHIVRSKTFVATDTFWSINPQNGSGLSLGILMQWNVSKYFQISTNLAQLVLDDRRVEFKMQYPGVKEETVEKKLISAPYLQWPIIFTLRSDKIMNSFRVYVFLGTMFNVDIGDKNLKSIRSLLIQNDDWGVMAGMGFHLYFPTVTISPQVVFSAGLNNVAQVEARNKFNSSIQELYNRTLSFSLIISP